MALGNKLQAVLNKVNTKLGTQDGDITFRKTTLTENTEFGRPYDAATNSDVVIAAGIKIGRVQAYQTDAIGTLKVGDLRLLIPGGLITEAQLDGARILYGGQVYSIISKRPTQIYSGVVVEWEVFARQEV